MGDYENIVELMLEAALRDGVETTIRRGHYHGTIEVVFRREGERVSELIDVARNHPNYLQSMLLNRMKSSLRRLLFGVYDKIGKAPKED